jgi:serpin B
MGGDSSGRSGRSGARRRYRLATAICVGALAAGLGLFSNALTDTGAARTPEPGAKSPPRSLGPAAATGAFGLDLMRALPPGNAVLSPDSVATALAMTGTGAAGRTADQMVEVLRLGNPIDFLRVGRLQRAIAAEQASAGEGHPKAPTLAMANGLFVQTGFPIRPAFVSGLEGGFGAAPEALDFAGDPVGSLNAIDGWVSERTAGIIPELLEGLPLGTRLVLTNAMYLDASWRDPFEPNDTAPGRFVNAQGGSRVDFMHEIARLRYGSGQGYTAVELPYRASTLSMLLVLPAGKSVAPLERRLAGVGLSRVARHLSPTSVSLSLPRFHIGMQATLNGPLMRLGMTDAFSQGANFSGIRAANDLKIGLVAHAADLRVDEEGTTAAAATAVAVEFKSKPRAETTFNANHPFLFFLRDRRTGAVLFAGRLVDAAAASP